MTLLQYSIGREMIKPEAIILWNTAVKHMTGGFASLRAFTGT
jgi:hypothetical protein